MQTVNPVLESKPLREFCGAKTRNGGTCKRSPMANGRCYMHGGPTPGGLASPNLTNGRYSKYLKGLPQLRKDYQAALADPAIVALDGELALLTVRAGELLDRLGKTKPPPWEKVQQLAKEALSLEGADQQNTIRELAELVNEGANAVTVTEQSWAELRELVQERARVASVEWKRLNDINGLVTVEQLLLFVRAFMDAARETVTDQAMLKAFQAKTVALLPPPKDE